MFYPGSAEARTVHVFKPSGNLKFGYAVDASWVYTDNVVDPLTDFSLAANSIEAYKIVPDKINGYQISAANPTDIKVEIFDHQGLETIDGVTIESPLLFNGEKSLEYESETPEGGWIFSGSFSNDLHAITGIYPVLIRVRDTWTDDNLGKVDAWQVVDSYINTTPNSGGWAISWGSELRDRGTAICLDSEQNIYVSGYRTIFGERSALVTKVNQQGVILWERVWRTHGIQYEEQTHGSWMVKSDGADGIYVAGIFLGETDFDPGPDLDLHNSNGEKDAFLSKFDTDGNFRWARTFGGSGNDEAYDIGINQAGNILITGKFSNSVDFDPGDGTNIQQSSGGFDMYISAFDPDGNYLWTETWGGSGTITSLPGMAFDDSGNLYVSANFSSEFDFDPGPDVFNVSSNGSTDIFLVKFDQSMNLEWVHTFGSSAADGSSGAFYQSPDSVFITGTFSNTVDFDPGPGNGSISSVGGQDSYVARYDLDGAFQWARGWGGSQTSPVQDVGHGVAFDSQGNVYVSGMFMGPECDFDPGPDEDIRPNMGVRDVYLVKFDLEGNYLQAQTWGSDKYDSGWKIAVDSHDNLFQVGYLAGTADMAANDPPCSEIASVHESNGDWDLFLIKYLADGCW
jgi:hypothetical protein